MTRASRRPVDAIDTLVASLRFDEPPVPLPTGAAAGPASIAAARAFFTAADAALRRGYGSVDVPDVTYYACFDGDSGDMTDDEIDIGPGGRLGGSVPVRCSWSIEPDRVSLWRLALRVDWWSDLGVAAYEETHWLDAAGESLNQVWSGDAPAYAPG